MLTFRILFTLPYIGVSIYLFIYFFKFVHKIHKFLDKHTHTHTKIYIYKVKVYRDVTSALGYTEVLKKMHNLL